MGKNIPNYWSTIEPSVPNRVSIFLGFGGYKSSIPSFNFIPKPGLSGNNINPFSTFNGETFLSKIDSQFSYSYFTSYLIFILAKKLFYDSSLALCCAFTFLLLPSVSLSSFLLSTDILLIFFWTAGLIQVLKIKKILNKKIPGLLFRLLSMSLF